MDSTRLALLTREGVIALEIYPPLAAEHYAELHDVVRDAETPEELRQGVRDLVTKWKRRVEFTQ